MAQSQAFVKYLSYCPTMSLNVILCLSTKIAEVIDERPDEVKQLEAFRTSNRWKVIGGDKDFCEQSKESICHCIEQACLLWFFSFKKLMKMKAQKRGVLS